MSALDFRTDIPADKYEGCRPAAVDVRLANYVNHTIKQNDVKRDYFSQTTFCFCFLDHRCNSSGELTQSKFILAIALGLVFVSVLHLF